MLPCTFGTTQKLRVCVCAEQSTEDTVPRLVAKVINSRHKVLFYCKDKKYRKKMVVFSCMPFAKVKSAEKIAKKKFFAPAPHPF